MSKGSKRDASFCVLGKATPCVNLERIYAHHIAADGDASSPSLFLYLRVDPGGAHVRVLIAAPATTLRCVAAAAWMSEDMNHCSLQHK